MESCLPSWVYSVQAFRGACAWFELLDSEGLLGRLSFPQGSLSTTSPGAFVFMVLHLFVEKEKKKATKQNNKMLYIGLR